MLLESYHTYIENFGISFTIYSVVYIIYKGVAKCFKATDFDSVIRWLESNHPCQQTNKTQPKLNAFPKSSQFWLRFIFDERCENK